MTMNDEQYQRIARWLDGADVLLSEAELAAADEIVRGERTLAPLMPADVPHEVLARASRRMTAELLRPARRLWIRRAAAAAAAAAAIIVLAILLNQGTPPPAKLPTRAPGVEMADMPIETLVEQMEAATRPGVVVELLAGELRSIEADMLVTAEMGGVDLKINAMEDEFDDILLNPAAPWSFDDGV